MNRHNYSKILVFFFPRNTCSPFNKENAFLEIKIWEVKCANLALHRKLSFMICGCVCNLILCNKENQEECSSTKQRKPKQLNKDTSPISIKLAKKKLDKLGDRHSSWLVLHLELQLLHIDTSSDHRSTSGYLFASK